MRCIVPKESLHLKHRTPCRLVYQQADTPFIPPTHGGQFRCGRAELQQCTPQAHGTSALLRLLMRKHIFLTGQPGVGKSTLIQRVLEQLQLPPHTATGFYTEEVRSGGERTGFDVVTLDGQRSVLSMVGTARKGAPVVGKYVVDVPSFESLALPAMQPQASSTQLVVIDEVGKMELFSAVFYPAVLQVLDNPQLLAFGTVPVARYGRTIPQVESLKSRPDVEVITVTKDNRDRLVADVCQRIQQGLQQLAGS